MNARVGGDRRFGDSGCGALAFTELFPDASQADQEDDLADRVADVIGVESITLSEIDIHRVNA